MAWFKKVIKSVSRAFSGVEDGVRRLGSQIDDKVLQPTLQAASWPLGLLSGLAPDMPSAPGQSEAPQSLEGMKAASKLANRRKGLFRPAGGFGPLGMMVTPTSPTAGKTLLGE